MICAIVLAAGRSKRMGVQKLLLPFAGKTIIEHIVHEVAMSQIEHTVVVTGADASAVTLLLSGGDWSSSPIRILILRCSNPCDAGWPPCPEDAMRY